MKSQKKEALEEEEILCNKNVFKAVKRYTLLTAI
jgi:hypothetical protein